VVIIVAVEHQPELGLLDLLGQLFRLRHDLGQHRGLFLGHGQVVELLQFPRCRSSACQPLTVSRSRVSRRMTSWPGADRPKTRLQRAFLELGNLFPLADRSKMPPSS